MIKTDSRKSKKGPVKIFAPILSLGDSDDEAEPVRKPYVPAAGPAKNNLLSLLPPPKNGSSFAKTPQSAAASSIPTPKPAAGALIPRSVSRPPGPSSSKAPLAKRRRTGKDSDDSDGGDDDVAFFTLEEVFFVLPLHSRMGLHMCTYVAAKVLDKIRWGDDDKVSEYS
jgi:hypothetical protein